MSPVTLRVLIAEDEPSVRAALSDLVDSEPGLEVVGVAGDANAAIVAARELTPDVALVDVRMPGGGGPHAIRGMREVAPSIRIVAVSAYEDQPTVVEMLRAGAVGYLIKGGDPREILEAIRRAVRNQASLSGSVMASVIRELVDDIGERLEREAVLEQSERKFRDLLDSSPDAVVMIDVDGRILLVNQQTVGMFGYRAGDLTGRRIEILLPERFRERHIDHRAGYFADPRARSMGVGLELAGLRKDGTEFPVDISLSSIETDGRRVATAFIRDVSGRERIAEARRREEERLAALLDSAPDAVVIIDPNGQIVLVNKQTEQLFGYPRADLLGEPIETLLPERFGERHRRHRAAYFRDPRTRPMGFGLELAGLRRDRTRVSRRHLTQRRPD